MKQSQTQVGSHSLDVPPNPKDNMPLLVHLHSVSAVELGDRGKEWSFFKRAKENGYVLIFTNSSSDNQDPGHKEAGKDQYGQTNGPANAEGKRPQLTYSYDKVPTLFLPAGPCQIKAKYGDKTVTADATVPAGILTEFTLKVKE